MDNQLIRKTIQIVDAKVDEKGNIKVKDAQGLTYTIWKTKQDGTDTVAFRQASKVNLLGGTFDISHDEKPVPNGTGMYRAIKAIYASTAQPTAQNIQSATSAPKTPYKPVSAPINEAKDWDAINKKKEMSMNALNAKKGAAEITAAMITAGHLNKDNWLVEFRAIADEIYVFNPDGKKEEYVPIPDEPSRFNEDAYPADGNDMLDKLDMPPF